MRAIRARYPNANPELGFGSELKTSWGPAMVPTRPNKEINPSTPVRDSADSFQLYNLGESSTIGQICNVNVFGLVGIGGPCKYFSPPAGYWCGTSRAGGGASMYTIPSAMSLFEF